MVAALSGAPSERREAQDAGVGATESNDRRCHERCELGTGATALSPRTLCAVATTIL
jgi:hypothetical protein